MFAGTTMWRGGFLPSSSRWTPFSMWRGGVKPSSSHRTSMRPPATCPSLAQNARPKGVYFPPTSHPLLTRNVRDGTSNVATTRPTTATQVPLPRSKCETEGIFCHHSPQKMSVIAHFRGRLVPLSNHHWKWASILIFDGGLSVFTYPLVFSATTTNRGSFSSTTTQPLLKTSNYARFRQRLVSFHTPPRFQRDHTVHLHPPVRMSGWIFFLCTLNYFINI